MENLFEQAVWEKWRFDSVSGLLTAEDLCDLPLTSKREDRPNLDSVAKYLHRRSKELEEESFVVQRTPGCDLQHNKLELVKHIIATKLAANKAKEEAKAAQEEIDKIDDILEDQADEALKKKTPATLKKRRAELLKKTKA